MRTAVLCSGSILWLAAFGFVQADASRAPTPQAPSSAPVKTQVPRTGAQIYKAACAACHGADGKGREQSAVGFDVPVPDFSDCSFATREPDADWLAVAHDGGPARAFSTHMPAFGGALSETELLLAVKHIRTFCASSAWPRGELNLPRTFFTEKAYPEDEAVLTINAATSGPGEVGATFVYERRFGARNQIELKLPLATGQDANGVWRGGAGDIAIGFKRAVAHSLEKGFIFALAGEVVLPSGDESAGLSKTTPVFEPFASFGLMLPRESFFQAQAGVELPFDAEKAEREAFWRLSFGRTWAQGPHGFGRTWTPMVEFIAARELESGAATHWDIVPQMQVSLSTRQHILLNAGVRLPLNQRADRHPQFLVYLLWDWFDGGFFSGWK